MNQRPIANQSAPLEATQVKESKARVQAEGNTDGNAKRKAPHKERPTAESYSSPAERRAEGKRLRDAVPRTEHSGWRPPRDRRDPVAIVLAQD